MHLSSTVAVLLVAMCVGGCKTATPVQAAVDESSVFTATFERSGGFAGGVCNLVIQADGTYSLHRLQGGHEEGESGTVSRNVWTDLLAQLKSAKGEYPASAADDFRYSANWKDRTIKWSALNTELPPALRTLTDLLNQKFDQPRNKGAL